MASDIINVTNKESLLMNIKNCMYAIFNVHQSALSVLELSTIQQTKALNNDQNNY